MAHDVNKQAQIAMPAATLQRSGVSANAACIAMRMQDLYASMQRQCVML